MTDEPTLDPDMDQAPQRIGDRFEIDRLIARGGMAAVYLAHQTGVGRQVALKVLRAPDDAEGPEDFEERFRIEARALASLNHPNIVTLYDFGRLPDGRCYLAMEYIDGPRLSDLMKAGPMEPARAIRLMIQVCRALHYAHRHGVIHRDLKPSNLLVKTLDDGTEHVKVVDFGLVKVIDSDQTLTRAGHVLGSPHCMSPEQVRGQEVDLATDIYAVGVLLFRAITGRYPFHGSNSASTMMAHLHQPVATFFSVDPRLMVPPGLEEITRRCLEKEPSRRYRSMAELFTELSALLDVPVEPFRSASFSRSLHVADLPLGTPPTATSGPVPQDGRAERRVFAAALVLGALGLASAVGWWTLSRGPPPTPSPGSDVAPAGAAAAPPAAPQPAAVGQPDGQVAPPIAPPEARPPASPKPPARSDPAAAQPPARPRPAEARPPQSDKPPPPRPPPARPALAPEPKPKAPEGYKEVPDDW